MKMRSTLVGGFLVLVGVSFLLKVLFGIDIPVIRVAIALGLVYMGIRLATGASAGGHFSGKNHDTTAFGDAEYEVLEETTEHTFSILFGRGSLDLTSAQVKEGQSPEIELNVFCAACTVYYHSQRPIIITVHTFVANAELPDGNAAVMGTLTYRSPGVAPDARCLRLRVNTGLSHITFASKTPLARAPSKT